MAKPAGRLGVLFFGLFSAHAGICGREISQGTFLDDFAKASPSGEEVWRLNCGADAFDFTDGAGNWWTKDEGFTPLYRWGYFGGQAAASTAPVAGTALDAVYQNYRWGGTGMSYRIEVPDGRYRVRLMFAETFWSEPGRRVFDVALEGAVVLDQLDVFALAGRDAALDRVFDVTVGDEAVDVTFPQVSADNAMIAGIEVKALSVSDDAFMDFIQRKMFWFFYNELVPGSPMVKDIEDSWQVGYGNYTSIAGVGWNLSVMTVAAHRGWITRREARDRVMGILDYFETAPHKQGFWYHIYESTFSGGPLRPTAEISNIDSAIFIAGALQAGEFFRGDFPEVAAKADALYRRMDWTWFLNRIPPGDPGNVNGKFLSMGWRPCEPGASIPHDGGCFINDWWNRYAETPLLSFLALGSPTHPVPANTWTDIRRSRIDWAGYSYIYEPGLFTHQYQHIYYDLRGKHDGFANYFDNSVWATLSNRASTVYSPLYDPETWGITACTSDLDNPTYYSFGVGPSGWHNGTVAPSAAGASVMFTPREALETLRYMYFQYKHAIWGRHGYTDSFNKSNKFRARYAGSLNNGAMILGIENARTGLIRDTFMRNPYAAAGLAAAGFRGYDAGALYVSSTSIQAPSLAGDGNMATRWESGGGDPQWLAVDYGTPRLVNTVTIQWEFARARDYDVQVSNDGVRWTTVSSVSNGSGPTDVARFPAVSARYVRMYGRARTTDWGYSIWEMSAALDDSVPSPWRRGIGMSATVTP